MDNHENMSDGKTSFLLFAVVIILVAISVAIYVAADIISEARTVDRSNADVVATAKRLAPVGQVNLASAPNPDLGKAPVAAAPAAPAAFSVESAYNASCASCHAAGILGAPAMGDAAAWAARTAAGIETVYSNAINGKGSMPPRGGSALSDDQIKQVVDYILDNSK